MIDNLNAEQLEALLELIAERVGINRTQADRAKQRSEERERVALEARQDIAQNAQHNRDMARIENLHQRGLKK